jgi:hypothetical protein
MNSNPEKPPEPNRWKPGQSGNPKGRPKSKPITAALKALLDKDDGKALKALAAVAVREALSGNFRYAKEILERIDGKVVEPIDLKADVNVQELPGATEEELAVLAKLRDGPED